MYLAALLITQQFAGTANLQVVRGQQVTRTQVTRRLYRFQPFGGIRSDGRAGRAHEVGVGLVVGAANAASQLVQLGQAEFVGALDDNGVGVGNIDAGFDDGRA